MRLSHPALPPTIVPSLYPYHTDVTGITTLPEGTRDVHAWRYRRDAR